MVVHLEPSTAEMMVASKEHYWVDQKVTLMVAMTAVHLEPYLVAKMVG